MKHIFTKIAVSSFLFPLLSLAEDTPGITNPLKPQFNSLPNLILGAVDIAITIGFYVAVFFIVYSGFLFVKARGNDKELPKAKEAFMWTVIGTAVLLGARVIADVIQGTLNQIQARDIPAEHIKNV